MAIHAGRSIRPSLAGDSPSPHSQRHTGGFSITAALKPRPAHADEASVAITKLLGSGTGAALSSGTA